MRSLRTRLTLSYAILVATILVLVVGALTVVVLDVFKRPLIGEIATAAQTARNIVAMASPGKSTLEIENEILRRVSRPGLLVIPLPPPPPQLLLDGIPPPNAPRWRLDVRSLIAPPPERIQLRDRVVMIGADDRFMIWAVAAYLRMLAIAVAVVIAVAWLVAVWMTRQAITPLLDVTARLRQFAEGNFSPAPLHTSDHAEIGALIAAYNGAAAQVEAAFVERTSVEEHMRRFVADAGHELRTPLSAIAGAHDILRKGGLDDASIRERIFRNLRTETQRMNALIERLITLARLERPEHSEPEVLDVAELANDTIAAVRAARGGRITLKSDEPAFAFADPGDVYDALGNLIDNAVKYGAGSPVVVEISLNSGSVVVCVGDSGPGIPPGDRPYIFERFYRGWIGRSDGGSGLGLSIAQRAIERAGGTLELRCGEPARTVFALTLPRAGWDESSTSTSSSRALTG
jgi:signal transduction histidine kinase